MSWEGSRTSLVQTSVAGTPSLLRVINERTVLESVRRVGPVSRAQIARETALSKPTVSQALAGLLRAKLVREAGRSSGGKGPTAVLYELNPHAGWVVGIDVGRHWVRAAIADVTGEFVARRDERARVKSARTLITQIGAVAHGLAGDAGIRWKQVTFATVGSPGVLEADRGQVALAYALPGWGRQGLVEAVQQELGTKIAFENDVNLAALGEQWHGIGKGVENFVVSCIWGPAWAWGSSSTVSSTGGAAAPPARWATSRWPERICVIRRAVVVARSMPREVPPAWWRPRVAWG